MFIYFGDSVQQLSIIIKKSLYKWVLHYSLFIQAQNSKLGKFALPFYSLNLVKVTLVSLPETPTYQQHVKTIIFIEIIVSSLYLFQYH